MSGGYFDYEQYKLGYIADSIEQLILNEASTELDDYARPKSVGYSPSTITEFKRAIDALNLATIYVQRIDWLVSGDDGEDSFHSRLEHDLLKVKALLNE